MVITSHFLPTIEADVQYTSFCLFLCHTLLALNQYLRGHDEGSFAYKVDPCHDDSQSNLY